MIARLIVLYALRCAWRDRHAIREARDERLLVGLLREMFAARGARIDREVMSLWSYTTTNAHGWRRDQGEAA